MKKIIYSLALASVITLPTLVLADDEVKASAGVEVRTSITERLKGLKDDVKERVELRKGEAESRKASTTERRTEQVSKLSKRMIEHAGKVMQATIDRLEKIATRIESRIAKLKANGGNTTLSESFLAEGKVHLTEAKTSLSAFLAIDLSTTARLNENIVKIREAASAVKTHLREAHASFVKAITNLKPGRPVEVHATTTATTTVQ